MGSRGVKKKTTGTDSAELHLVFGSVSKSALFDALIDVCRTHTSSVDEDGPELESAVREVLLPVLLRRGDVPPKPWSKGEARRKIRAQIAKPA